MSFQITNPKPEFYARSHRRDLMPILQIGRSAAYTLVRSGQIHSVRVGRSYRIPREAVLNYLRKTS